MPGGYILFYSTMKYSILDIIYNKASNFTTDEINYLKSIYLPYDGDMLTTVYRAYGYDEGEPENL